MVIFISCVKNKKKINCKAEEMYQSDLFKKSLNYAKSLKPRKIYILSALYGVLELSDIIEPYNKTLNNMKEIEKKEWANKVIEQLKNKNINFNEETLFLCGKNYRKYLINNFFNSDAPLKNLGIGKQLAFYKKILKKNKQITLFDL